MNRLFYLTCQLLAFCCFGFVSLQAQSDYTLDLFTSDTWAHSITPDTEGNLWAAQPGTGNDDGRISIITPDGAQYPFMVGLPSVITSVGDVAGPWRVFVLPGDQVAIIMGEGSSAYSASVLWVSTAGFTPGDPPLTIADIDNQVSFAALVTGAGFENNNPYSAVWDSNGDLYVVDAGANSILKYDAMSGEQSIFATFPGIPNPTPVGGPFIDPVPTDILLAPDGSGFWVSTLTGFPFLPGLAGIHHIDWAGNINLVHGGLSQITDIDLDADGNIIATQFGSFDLNIFNFVPDSGNIIAIEPDGTVHYMLDSLTSPTGIALLGSDTYIASLFTGNVYRLQESGTLPVELLQFSGRATDHANLLQWATASETNCQLFELSRSTDGVSFEHLAKIAASGNSNSPRSYTYADDKAQKAGTYYYRLSQTDFDGNTRHLSTISLRRGDHANSVQIGQYGTTVWVSTDQAQALSVALIDLSGHTILRQNITASIVPTTLALPNGLCGFYLLQCTNGQETWTQKVRF